MFGKTGAQNPFFGKHHTEEAKAHWKKLYTGQKLSPEHAAKVIEVGKKNLLQGSPYDLWVEKYGITEADRRIKATKAKHSKNNSGSGNPMFGKPSPTGSGNGWSGWYKGWYFRSLRELKFVLDLESTGQIWTTGEKQKISVPYVSPLGTERTYFPDFIIDNRVVEVKPKRLWTTHLVLAKSKAAIPYFAALGMTYELVDPGKIDDEVVDRLYETAMIKWLPRYEKKYQERKQNHV
jgi:hypothetical protein